VYGGGQAFHILRRKDESNPNRRERGARGRSPKKKREALTVRQNLKGRREKRGFLKVKI